ncbi:MAG: OmpA family protein [Candidatus Cyclobacteriaceae bacterium M3_2C_046]
MKKYYVQFSKSIIVKFLTYSLIISFTAASISGCKSWSNTAKGGAIGAAGGAAAGAAIGKAAGNTAAGAIFGAAVGGVAGAAIGAYMDKQANELEEDLEGAKVERIGEGIKITFDSGILFGFDKSDLTAASRENIQELAQILKKYDDTNVLIEGHTDSKGSEEYNQNLSERRAESVADYVTNLGVDASRLITVGYGEAQPVAANDSEAGRAENRRVELAIYANEKLKRAAKRGQLD